MKSRAVPELFVSPRKGFTLIEMMVVVAMIALITAAVAPMVFNTLVSTRLTSAGETLAGQLSLAQQIAVSRNQTVEVRFYQYVDPESPGSKPAYRALAIMQASSADGATNQLNKQLTDTYYLPSGIAVSDSAAMSPILASGRVQSEADKEKIIRRASDARYKAFLVRADGSTNLEQLMRGDYRPNQCYFTLGEDRVLQDSSTVPKNFYAVQIDPSTGRTSTYRP
jgi:uncharacterized protein (TIGR02596 family)